MLNWSILSLLARRYGAKLIFLTGMILSASALFSAELKQDIQKPDTLYLGSRIYLKLSAKQDLADVVVPDTLTKYAVITVDKDIIKGKPIGLTLTIVPLDTGTHTFPSILVNLAKPSQVTLESDSITFTINEIRSLKDTTLVDIAGTQKLKGELPVWAYYAIAGLIILAILVILFLLWRKYRKKKVVEVLPEPVYVDPRTHLEKALDALYELKQQNLPHSGEFIAYHFRLSEIMKQYLEAEFGFSANEMTTKEIKQYFRKDNCISMTEQKVLIDWLEGCDRVKFAKHDPTLQECDDKMDWVCKWLRSRKAKPEPIKTEVSHDA